MLWTASHGDRLGVTGCSTLEGGTTLGGVSVGDISGYGSDTPFRYWKSRWGVENMCGIGTPYPTFCVSATCKFLFCLGGEIGGVCC